MIRLNHRTVDIPQTSHSFPAGSYVLATLRLSTDPYFYADVVIHGAVIGSRYYLFDKDNPGTALATGVIANDPETITNVPSYGSPMILALRLRKASSHPYYKPLEVYAPHNQNGTDFYVSQELDE